MKRHYTKTANENAKKLRQNQTDTEGILWHYLRNRGLNNIKFRRQVPIGKYIADFVCMDKKLIIELDGSQHLEVENVERDKKKNRVSNEIRIQSN